MAPPTFDAGSWSSTRRIRPRVLMESSDVAVGWALGNALDRAGYEVAVCHGPSVHGTPCPLVQGGECPLAAGADVIVSRMWLSEPANRDVLRLLPTYVPGTPVIVEAGLQDRERHADVLAGCRVVPVPLTARGLLGVVHDERTRTAGLAARDR